MRPVLSREPYKSEPGDIKQLSRLLSYIGPYRSLLAVALVATTFSSLLGLVFPNFVGRLIDGALSEARSAAALDRIALGLIVIFALQAVFNYLNTYLLVRVGQGVVADLRKALFTHLLTLPVRFFENRKTGEITSRLTSDASTVQNAVSGSLVQFINQAITLIGGIVIIFVTSWKLSLVMLSVVPVVILLASFAGRRLRKLSTQVQDRLAEANANAEEAIVGVRVVQAFTAEQVETHRYSQRILEALKLAVRVGSLRAAYFGAGISFATFTSLALVIWFGGRLVLAGEMTVGALVSFLFYTFFVAISIASFTGLYATFQETLGASRRIFTLLDEQSEIKAEAPNSKLGEVRGQVSLENVSFRYGDRGNTYVLQGVSLRAHPGQVVALVGPSGAGKSTVVSLIPRFYDPSAGRILLDGINIRQVEPLELRQHIAIVPQETQLFSGTIEENIRYGKPQATQAEVLEAAKAANAHEFISAFPQGYQTLVGERGVKLSGGQRQRIAIARALLKNPRILILDEATSSLDSESEALVQEALDKLMQGRTTFVIAHRLSTVRNADQIVVLDKGQVVQQGTHEELLAQGGLYKDLYELQFREETPLA
ncbi:ABC transporter transmembrane domain-containing protein [Meiothermus sp.]|uniref:ABC transporter ATP-binding protein n=1 Tax=Meiothermus sp. TaxID=1955249 RepID=UPI00307F3D48